MLELCDGVDDVETAGFGRADDVQAVVDVASVKLDADFDREIGVDEDPWLDAEAIAVPSDALLLKSVELVSPFDGATASPPSCLLAS